MTAPPLRSASSPPRPRPPPPPPPGPPVATHVSLPLNTLGLSVTFTLGLHVSPPSSEARIRMFQLMLSSKSRRSYQATATTPSLFTATTGVTLSGPLTRGSFAGLSSLITCSRDQVLPLSLLYESMTSSRPVRKSDQVT